MRVKKKDILLETLLTYHAYHILLLRSIPNSVTTNTAMEEWIVKEFLCIYGLTLRLETAYKCCMMAWYPHFTQNLMPWNIFYPNVWNSKMGNNENNLLEFHEFCKANAVQSSRAIFSFFLPLRNSRDARNSNFNRGQVNTIFTQHTS